MIKSLRKYYSHPSVTDCSIRKDFFGGNCCTARCIIDFLEQNKVYFLLKRLSFAKRAHKRDRQYQFWQEGCHPELIWSEAVMRQKLEYIHYNPVKRGYVAIPEHWRYSSAAHYAGQEGIMEIDSWS